MLLTILISIALGMIAALALGVCGLSMHRGMHRFREIRSELVAMNAATQNRPYAPQSARGMWVMESAPVWKRQHAPV